VLWVIWLSIWWLSLASNNAETQNNTTVQSTQTNLLNLPAFQEKLTGLEESLNAEKSETEREFERFEAFVDDRFNRLEKSINDQINRRELETYKYIDLLDQKKKDRIDSEEERIMRLEQEIFDATP